MNRGRDDNLFARRAPSACPRPAGPALPALATLGLATLGLATLGLATLACTGCGNRSPMVPPKSVPGRDLNATGLRFLRDGDLGRAEIYFLRAVADCAARDHVAGRAEALYHLALVHREQKRFGEAVEQLHTAESLFRRLERPEGVARSVAALASVRALEGNTEGARREYERALLEAPDDVAPEILTNLAMVMWKLGRGGRARDLAEQAVAQARDATVLADALFNLAALYIEEGRLPEAELALERVLRFDRETGQRRRLAETLALLGRVSVRQGELGRAVDYFERAAGVFESLGLDDEAARLRERAKDPGTVSTDAE